MNQPLTDQILTDQILADQSHPSDASALLSSPETSPAPATTSHPRKQRSMIIDIVRGIAITLVVLGHTNQGILHRGWWGAYTRAGSVLDSAIYTFHMPAFFFVSGVFLCPGVAKRGPWHYTRDKLRTMIYPYLLWAVIYFVLINAFQHYTVQGPLTLHKYLLDTATGNVSWFLPTIFVTVTLGMLLRRVPPPVLFLLTAAIALLWHNVGATDIDAAIAHLPFLVTGMWVGNHFSLLERLPRLLTAALAIVLAALILTATVYGVFNLKFLLIPLGLTGTLMLMLLAQSLGRSWIARFFAWAGEASFGIFLLSQFPQGAGREFLRQVVHTTSPVPQLLLPTFLAVALTGWLYQHRIRLHIGWMFIWPFTPTKP